MKAEKKARKDAEKAARAAARAARSAERAAQGKKPRASKPKPKGGAGADGSAIDLTAGSSTESETIGTAPKTGASGDAAEGTPGAQAPPKKKKSSGTPGRRKSSLGALKAPAVSPGTALSPRALASLNPAADAMRGPNAGDGPGAQPPAGGLLTTLHAGPTVTTLPTLASLAATAAGGPTGADHGGPSRPAGTGSPSPSRVKQQSLLTAFRSAASSLTVKPPPVDAAKIRADAEHMADAAASSLASGQPPPAGAQLSDAQRAVFLLKPDDIAAGNVDLSVALKTLVEAGVPIDVVTGLAAEKAAKRKKRTGKKDKDKEQQAAEGSAGAGEAGAVDGAQGAAEPQPQQRGVSDGPALADDVVKPVSDSIPALAPASAAPPLPGHDATALTAVAQRLLQHAAAATPTAGAAVEAAGSAGDAAAALAKARSKFPVLDEDLDTEALPAALPPRPAPVMDTMGLSHSQFGDVLQIWDFFRVWGRTELLHTDDDGAGEACVTEPFLSGDAAAKEAAAQAALLTPHAVSAVEHAGRSSDAAEPSAIAPSPTGSATAAAALCADGSTTANPTVGPLGICTVDPARASLADFVEAVRTSTWRGYRLLSRAHVALLRFLIDDRDATLEPVRDKARDESSSDDDGDSDDDDDRGRTAMRKTHQDNAAQAHYRHMSNRETDLDVMEGQLNINTWPEVWFPSSLC